MEVCIFGVLTVNPVNPCSSFVLTLCFYLWQALVIICDKFWS